jgi:uncharacterized Zn-binding protein involved in type VI secretion
MPPSTTNWGNMGIPFIVLGDTTNKGGRVIEASMFTDTHGKGIARVGDRVTCHNGCRIATGDHTMMIDGAAASRHGDKTTCGATLISSQAVTTDDPGTSASPSGETLEALLAQQKANALVFDNDEQFRAIDELGEPIPGLPYFLKLADGSTRSGITDAEGRCERIDTFKESDLTVWFGDEAEVKMQSQE